MTKVSHQTSRSRPQRRTYKNAIDRKRQILLRIPERYWRRLVARYGGGLRSLANRICRVGSRERRSRHFGVFALTQLLATYGTHGEVMHVHSVDESGETSASTQFKYWTNEREQDLAL
ncbi:hypothetical protein Kim5_PA00375 (plasmid) [Rhizobium sp. Kim5]|nr:hypothetical protein Kim5_PA00375 [Rhizobium sp. Kim5]